jgi:hypothetical protein
MALLKWFSRRGAVGGTARWAADTYFYFRTIQPSLDNVAESEIFRQMIELRYKAVPDPVTKESLLLDLQGISMEGLSALVVAILTHEANFMSNSESTRRIFDEVIEEELEKRLRELASP